MAEHEHPLLSYRELIAELKQLLSDQAVGVMFICTLDNHAVHLGVDKGNIVGCRFRFKRGADALPMILEMEAGHYSFVPGPTGPADGSLPATDELLQMLDNSEQNTSTDLPIQGETDLSALPTIITSELTRYLGPIAAVLIEDYLDEEGPARDSGALQKMITSMASEIADVKKRDEFTKAVLNKLSP
ncbi:MAG: hypothetical protein GY753_07720 [Gammaproteobacteria bacterium]|nr:hypothetical protein [Gammaproteobacteria bacterium]